MINKKIEATNVDLNVILALLEKYYYINRKDINIELIEFLDYVENSINKALFQKKTEKIDTKTFLEIVNDTNKQSIFNYILEDAKVNPIKYLGK